MANIICDTNIWYGLADGTITERCFAGHSLVFTNVSYREITTTYTLITNPAFISKVCQSILRHTSLVMPQTAIEQIVLQQDDTYPSTKMELVQDPISFLAHVSEFSPEGIIALQKQHDDKVLALAAVNENANAKAETIRKRLGDKQVHKDIDTLALTKEFINKVLVGQDTKGAVVLGDNYPWNNIELFLTTLDTFFKELETSTRKVKINDWGDLAILAFVKPGDLFWANDKRLRDMIKMAGMGHYLFEPTC